MLAWQLRRPIHISWLVALLCLGVSTGLFASNLIDVPLLSLHWLAVAAVLALVGFRVARLYAAILVCLSGMIIGVWRGSNYQVELMPYASVVGEHVTIRGKVKEDADIGKRGDLVLRLGDISIEGRALKGSVWVSLAKSIDVKRGDIVTMRGRLSEGFGSFSASMFRAEVLNAERPVPGDVALRVRDWFADAVRRAVPEPEASLGVGYLVGQRRALPEELDAALQATGLTHVVVASGYNLTILVSVSRRLFERISKFQAAFFSGGMTIGFMAVTGLSPSMSRAGLVTGMGLLAWYYGRRFHPLVLLPVAAAVTLMINPLYGQNDLGWQLSFASFTGVLAVAPLLQSYFFGQKQPGVMRQILFETLSAWVCTLPLIILAFGQFSNVAIIANILVLPLVPLAMLLTFIAGAMTLALPALAGLAGFPATLILSYMTSVTIYLGSVPWAQTVVELAPQGVILSYLALAGLCYYMWRKTKYDFTGRSALGVNYV